MSNSKTTKRALLGSAVSMLLCVSMLIGSTFAWFTDTATSAGNKIMAGKLDVELYMYDGEEYTNISTEKKPIFGSYDSTVAQNNNLDTLWEPGKTQVAYLMIKNAGNLALKYKVALNTINPADSKDLYKVMQYQIVNDAKSGATWTPNAGNGVTPGTVVVSAENVQMQPNDEHYFALLIHMDENAGNDYKNGKVEFDISVLATQLNSEGDSFGTDYDIDSMYAAGEGLYVDETTGAYVALSTEGLSTAAALASEDTSITSVKYNDTEVPVVRDDTALNEAITDNNSIVVLTADEYIIPDSAKNKALTIVGTEGTTLAAQDDGAAEGDCDYSFEGSDVTFENVTISTPTGSSYPGYVRMDGTYNNCTFKGTYTLYGDSIFNNCTFDLNNGYVWTWGASKVEFNNCTFEDNQGMAKAILVHNTVETEVIVKDCKFIATTPAKTWDDIPVAAVSIDPEKNSPDAVVRFEGTNTYSDAFNGLYQLKYATEVDDVTVYVNGKEVDVPVMKETHP